MPTSPDEEFIVIENQVAMTEKPVAKLLGVTIERLHELSRTVGVTNKKGGIYELSGQYVYTSFEIIFKVRDANGRNSADLSTFKLSGLFAQAEKRLLPKQYRQKENRTMLKVGLIFLAIFVCASLFSDNSKGANQTKQAAPPKVETVAEKPKPPKVQTPEESFYVESYEAIAAKTKLRVTDSWLLEYGERVTPDGNVDTHGFVELNDDGIKRQFWLMFDGKTRQVLRVKIDGTLVYSAVGW